MSQRRPYSHMTRCYRFPIKGSYYYDATRAHSEQLLQAGRPLRFQVESDNPHDVHAVQIWLTHVEEETTGEYLLGYLPRALAYYWQPLIRQRPECRLMLQAPRVRGPQLHLEAQCEFDLTRYQHLYFTVLCGWLRLQARWRRRHRPSRRRGHRPS